MNCPSCRAVAFTNGYRFSERHGRARRYKCLCCKNEGRKWTFYGPVEQRRIREIKLRASVKQAVLEYRCEHWLEVPIS